MNLLERAEMEVGRDTSVRNIELPREAVDGCDLKIFIATNVEPGRSWRTESGSLVRVVADGRAELEFSDGVIADTGSRLETHPTQAMETSDLLTGERWVVNYGNPNATKAMHVGHLRQLAIGEALASMREAAGADVVRQSRVCDYGRSVGEALAGYRAFGYGTPLGAGEVKGDQFIGRCYAEYVATLAAVDGAADNCDVSLSREGAVRKDEPEMMLADWRAGGETTTSFEAMRDWVLEGHEATMCRLGIEIDRILLESEHIDHGLSLQRRALERGLVFWAPNGATLYETGEEGYPHLMLTRPDGFPTQNLRYMAAWDAVRGDYLGAGSIGVVGSEWGPMSRFSNRMLSSIHGGDEEVHPKMLAEHGMVTAASGVIKSSDGDDAWLIDQMLDRLVACEWMRDLRQRCEWVDPEAVAPVLALAFFLGRTFEERVEMDHGDFTSPRRNWGCWLVDAWAQANDPAHDDALAREVRPDPAYRALVVRSQIHRRLLNRSLAKAEVMPMVRFYLHLCRWYLFQPSSAGLARAMRGVLTQGMVTLGLRVETAPRRNVA